MAGNPATYDEPVAPGADRRRADVRLLLVRLPSSRRGLRRAVVAAGCAAALLPVAACSAGSTGAPASAVLGSTTVDTSAAHRIASSPGWALPSPGTTPPTPSPTGSPLPPKPRRPAPPPTTTPPTTPPPPTPAPIHYRFPAAGCHVSYGSSHHDYPATDIFAPRGCHFVAVVRGRVDEVTYHDTWDAATNKGAARGGLSVSIVGADGVRYYGSHLEKIARGIKPGVRVRAGQLLGYVGNTGDARGIATHIHFGISWPTVAGKWWIRRGEVSPYRFLNAWRDGTDRSPRAAVRAERRALDGDPRCRVDC